MGQRRGKDHEEMEAETGARQTQGKPRATSVWKRQGMDSLPETSGGTTLLTSWPWISGLQNWKRINFCWVVSHPVCGNLLRQPQETKTLSDVLDPSWTSGKLPLTSPVWVLVPSLGFWFLPIGPLICTYSCVLEYGWSTWLAVTFLWGRGQDVLVNIVLWCPENVQYLMTIVHICWWFAKWKAIFQEH